MPAPIENWEMKIVHFLFGQNKVIQLEGAKFLYNCTTKTKQLQQVKQKMSEALTWNFGAGVAFALLTSFGLQRVLPWFRTGINMTNLVIDGGIFMLWAGLSGLYSLSEMESQIEPFRKIWINQHNPEYLRVMREMNRNYEINLQNQIKKYVPANLQHSWKIRYDELVV